MMKANLTETVLSHLLWLCNLIAGGILRVSKRLDARYDWLPSPSTALAKYGHLLVLFVGDACDGNILMNVKDDYLALVSMEGAKCSYFTKVSSFSFTVQHITMGLPWTWLSAKLFICQMFCHSSDITRSL